MLGRLVVVRAASALPLVPGDRYVLRETGREETVGGGEILDVDPVLPAARARPSRSVARVVAERGWVDAGVLERLTGEQVEPTVGRWVVDPAVLDAEVATLREALDAAGPAGIDLAALDDRRRLLLGHIDGASVEAGRARVGQGDPIASHPYLAALRENPFTPPPPDRVGAEVLRAFLQRGLAAERDGMVFAQEAVDAAAVTVATLLSEHPEGVTVSDVRAALGISRKYALPLLGILDATGVTRRRGDMRIAGPRLPDPRPETSTG